MDDDGRIQVGGRLCPGTLRRHVKGLLESCRSLRSLFTSPGNKYKRGVHHSYAEMTQGLKNVALVNSFAELEIGHV